MQKESAADLLEPSEDILTMDFFSGGGEMGERIRTFDWGSTPLGPMECWSPALRTMLGIMLANRFPHILWWGPHYIQFYNDPYIPIPGAKHPDKVLGRPGSECWSEIWHVIGPLVDRPFNGGPATWDDDILLEVRRHGFLEETHFTIAYSPVPDDTASNGIGGVLATVHEITEKVIAERRVVVLRDLGATVGEARTADEACALAARTIEQHPKDIPFALLYLLDSHGARLAAAAGMPEGSALSPRVVDFSHRQNIPWPFTKTLEGGRMQVVENLAARSDLVPRGPWSEPPNTAVIVAIPSNNPREPAGLMVIGLSARLKLDQFYQDFVELVKNQIAAAIANARAYEEERKRAEALAELDRAKTAFFSNVSHEFRTPLTLMLGPVEDLLGGSQSDLPAEVKAQLELVNRNGQRLLRLVNTLLDFSRIEAGRMQAVFEPTDLAAFTCELASVFRSATERAGLKLMIDCPSLPEPVYVDRDMWEKVVLNLISNAFKFTFEGEIEVSLKAVKGRVELRVRDTGVGIPAKELPRIFERFHRVENTRSRTHEGSGIGLALVQELVRLHGGDVRSESVLGVGSTFIVSVPLGKEHLPPERLGAPRTQASTALGAAPFLEEALRWLPQQAAELIEPIARAESAPASSRLDQTANGRSRILVADDNADLRQYLARLLTEKYDVQTVADGAATLAAARERRPDLILSDIMMPRLDGFGLLRELRSDAGLKTVPIILLSARAGEESRVEGLQHGADDYLVKPFSARELLARVASRLEMVRLRKEFQSELERLVAARTKSLEETTEQLNDFCYSIAHDLKAPIRTQVSFANLLLDEFSTRLGTDGSDYVARMREAAQRQAKLVNDLLSHMSLNRAELPLEPTELARSVEAVCSDLYSEAQAGGAVIQRNAVNGLVLANNASLHLVLSNLLSNALKFVAAGKRPVVSVWTERRTSEAGRAVVRLWVEDNGIGIPARSHDKIFGVFERLHPRERYPGTGMGLAIVKRAVERMGGRVGVESEPGQGSRFWVELRPAGEAQGTGGS